MELDVTVHVEHVAAARKVIVPTYARPAKGLVPHDRYFALRHSAPGWVVDIGDHEPLDTFTKPVYRIGSTIAYWLRR